MIHIASLWRSGVGFILLAAAGYSLFPVFVRGLSDGGMASLDIATWRFVLAVPLAWAIIAFRRAPARSGGPMPRRSLMLTGVLMCVAAVVSIIGIQLIPAAVYVLLFYSYPTMVALISVLRGERLERNAWLSLGLALVGIALTVPDLSAGLGENANLQGVLLALVNAVAVAIFYVINGQLLKGVRDTPRASAYSLTGSGLPLYLWALLHGVALPHNAQMWLLLLGFTVISTVLPMVALNAGIQRLGAPRASILGTFEPVLTLVWSVLLLGDTIHPTQLLGGALILTSLILLQVKQLRAPTLTSNRAIDSALSP